jgi:hypothetical protein
LATIGGVQLEVPDTPSPASVASGDFPRAAAEAVCAILAPCCKALASRSTTHLVLD